MLILKKLVAYLRYSSNAFKNTIVFSRSKKIIHVNESEITLRGASISDLGKIELIYKTLNKSKLPNFIKILLKYCDEKSIIIAEKKIKDRFVIVGIDVFYFNSRDFKEFTIHEGFIGVLSEFEGKGIATQMRKLAKEHFRNAGFKGISTRISKDNLASLNSAKKLGFEPVENYFDSLMNEERYYLICNLKEEK